MSDNAITITLTEIQMLGLQYAELDPEILFQSQAEGRANAALKEIVQIEMDRALDAGETLPPSRDEIVQQAFANGTIKTAKQRFEDAQHAATTEAAAPVDPQEAMQTAVMAHALALKIGAVNAHMPPTQQYPATKAGLTTIVERYNGIISAFNTAKNLGMDVTEEQTQQAGLILQVYQYHAVVDDAVDAILAAGDPADPIASDPRWPLQ